MSDQVFLLPDLGEGLLEAELVRWLVQAGDTIAVDTPVAEVETAKAMMELPSPYGGVITALHAGEGTTVPVGAPLISVAGQQEPVLVGYGPNTAAAGGHRRGKAAVVAARTNGRVPAAASPVVRKLAKERGVDLTVITGTGQGGVITRADLEKASTPGTDGRTGLPIGERIPLQGTRKLIADTMSRSRGEIPEATIWADVDATELLAVCGRGRPGLLAHLARFVVAGLARHPALNSTVDGAEIRQLSGVNLGIATQTPRGLLVPAVRAAHTHTTRELDAEIRRVTTAAREGTATATDLGCGSFTLNNYGRFRVDGSAAIINHPEVAILGIGRIMPRPWVIDGQLLPRHIGQLSLVFDHRVCDGEVAAGFLRFVADAIESPTAALADL